MNAITPIAAATDPESWSAANTAAHAWRGRCLDSFARAEAAVSETLVVLAAVPKRGEGVALPLLVGQRFEALAAAVGADGPFTAEGKTVAKALAKFREQESLRVLLCHGVAKVALDQKGRWLLVLRLLALRSKQPQRTVLVVEQEEAETILDDLIRAGQRLSAPLGNLRRDVMAKASS